MLEALFEFASGELRVGFSESISIKLPPTISSDDPNIGKVIIPEFPNKSVKTAPFRFKAEELL